MNTIIDLFAGCGGLSLGLEQAGFSPVCFSEISTEAAATYKHNRPHINWEIGLNYFPDARDMVAGAKGKCAVSKLLKKLNLNSGELGLVCGGPPCQGFSRIGHRRIHATDRENIPTNHLYIPMAEVVRRAKPKLFLFENVQGLLTARWKDRSSNEGNKGEVFTHVLQTFDSLEEYVIRYRLVRAYDYGVPQNRPRVFVVGIRRDVFDKLTSMGIVDHGCGPLSVKHKKTRTFPEDALEVFKGVPEDGFFPDGMGLEVVPTVKEVLSDLIDIRSYEKIIEQAASDKSKMRTLKYRGKPASVFQREMRSPPPDEIRAIWNGEWNPKKVLNHEYSLHSERTRGRFRKIQKVGRAEGKVKNKKFSQRALPETWTNGKPNITVCSMPDDYVHYHETQNRSLTAREWARLQTFPDWYFFCGKRTTGGLRRAGRPQEGIFDREVPQYTQIGNAVPVRLAKVIGDHFNMLLEATL